MFCYVLNREVLRLPMGRGGLAERGHPRIMWHRHWGPRQARFSHGGVEVLLPLPKRSS